MFCFCKGKTAQSLCVRCVVRFFDRLPRNSAGILPYGKGFLGNMTENLHADCVQSRQTLFVRYCLNTVQNCRTYFMQGAIEGRRHISALQTESTFFTSEICAKKALHKMQKVCYNDIMHSLCISNRFRKRFHASF